MSLRLFRALANYTNNNDTNTEESREPKEDEKRVLMMNVLQPLYPITVSVMHKISQEYGKVLRILIFRKNGVQVMVEVSLSLIFLTIASTL